MMHGWMMFSCIIYIVFFPSLKYVLNCFWFFLHLSQWKRMSMDLVRFGWIVCFTTPSAVVLSICIGVGNCGWPIFYSRCRSGTASRALM